MLTKDALLKGTTILLLVLSSITLILSLVSKTNPDIKAKEELLQEAREELAKAEAGTDKEATAAAISKEKAAVAAFNLVKPDARALQPNAIILVMVAVLLLLLENNGAFKLNIKNEPIIIVVPLFLLFFSVLSLVMPSPDTNGPLASRGTLPFLKRIKGGTTPQYMEVWKATGIVGSIAYGICALVGVMFGGSVLMK